MQRLFTAISEHNLPRVVQLVERGADVNACDYLDETPLLSAVRNRFAAALPCLLSAGADVDADAERCTPLQMAYGVFDVEAVRILRAHGAKTDWLGPQNIAAFILTAMEGRCEDLAGLLASGIDIGAQDRYGRTALMCAAGAGQVECVRLLLERRADVNQEEIPTGSNVRGLTALVYAADEGYTDIVSLLLDMGADPNDVFDEGWTALTYAAMNRHVDTMRLLLQRDASVEGSSGNEFYRGGPLSVASWMGCEECVQLLLEHGAGQDPDALQEAFRATYVDNGANVQPLLLQAGVQIGLIEAILERDIQTVRQKIQQGANVNEKDRHGRTPLMYATGAWSWFVSPEIIRLLLDAGADVHAQTPEGFTALSLILERKPESEAARLIREASDTRH